MKTKFLLSLAVIVAASFWSINAQRLLLSEDISSAAWQAELLRLNPGSTDGTSATLINPNATNVTPYAPKSPATIGTNVNASYNTLNSTDLYFNKYKLSGDIETIGGMTSDVCAADGGNHNVLITNGVYNGSYLPVGFRPFKTTGFFEFPEVSSAGRIYAHVRCGNNTNGTKTYIQKWDGVNWVTLDSLILKKRSLLTTTVDENLYYNVNTRTPIKLRIANLATTGYFLQIYEVNIEEHASVELKQSIDSAVAIRAANAGNIGTAIGQYPQAVYDSLGVVVTNSTAVFDNTESTRATLLSNITKMNDAITYFNDNVNDVGTGINPMSPSSFKQYGRKLVINKPATISVYNTVGTLVYQQELVMVMEIPSSVGKGVFLVKSGSGVRKIYLGE